jgi:hypothetical protein
MLCIHRYIFLFKIPKAGTPFSNMPNKKPSQICRQIKSQSGNTLINKKNRQWKKKIDHNTYK